MKKRVIALIGVILVFAMLFAACDSKPGGEDEQGTVVLYTASSTGQNELVQEMWSAKYPNITLEIVNAGSGELQNRIIAEGDNPQGDVMMGGSFAVYTALDAYLTPYSTPNLKDCIDKFVSPNNKYTAIQINVNTIMINNKLVKDAGVTVDGWESLTNPALKGKIIFADPSSSSSGREHVINMLAAMNGTGKMEDGWPFVEKYIINLDGKISSSSSAIPTGVANGEYAVGITNEELVIENMLNGADVSPVYAKEGITLRNSYCGIIKGCKNEENAKLLVDFFTSKEYQQAIGEKLNQRSVRKDVAFSVPGIAATEDLIALDYPSDWVEANTNKVKETFQDLWTKH